MITHCLDMIDLFNYQRRKSSVAKIGNLLIGGENPIRVQSMTTTDTNDTQACDITGPNRIEEVK